MPLASARDPKSRFTRKSTEGSPKGALLNLAGLLGSGSLLKPQLPLIAQLDPH